MKIASNLSAFPLRGVESALSSMLFLLSFTHIEHISARRAHQ